MSRPRVLLIDDDAHLTDMVGLMFRADGSYELQIENDSGLALQAAQEFKPDVILLDIVMPGMDGGDISALLQEDPLLQETPVVVISALVRHEDTGSENSVDLRGKTMLPKPFNFKLLKDVIDLKLAEIQ